MKMIIDILVVWRLTHLIAREDGPFDIIIDFKAKLKMGTFWFKLLWCPYCLSVWFGVPWAMFMQGLHFQSLIYGVALSGAASLLQLYSGEK